MDNSFISSSSFRQFNTDESFIKFVKERESNTVWHECASKHVAFSPLYDEPIMAPAVAKHFACNEEAVNECMGAQHSGLISRFDGVAAPVGDSAIRTILARMAVKGAFYDRQRKDPAVFANDCNSSFSATCSATSLKR